MTGDEAEKMLDLAASKLHEHFDAVQIMVSWNEDGFTKCTKRGCGNWYARQGMAKEFMDQDQAQTTAWYIGEELNPPDESQAWKDA